jgi:hypothetical protein
VSCSGLGDQIVERVEVWRLVGARAARR